MNDNEAVEIARNWLAQRKEVRNHLVALARKANPAPERFEIDGQGNEKMIRKLYQYPSDLTEERLLNLIGDRS